MLQLRQKIASATSAIKSVFGQEENRQEDAVSLLLYVAISVSSFCNAYLYCFDSQSTKLERLRERMIKVRELFRDTNSTEFVIVTIPTVMVRL